VYRMRRTRGWDPLVFLPWSLVAFSLCITVMQGWNCTLRYLSQPVTVQEEFVSLKALPPVQLSVCKKFTIYKQPAPKPIDFSEFMLDDVYEASSSVPLGSILTFGNSSEEFWQGMASRWEHYRFELTLTLTSSNYYMSPLSLSACFSH
jgi:hypothetical protein